MIAAQRLDYQTYLQRLRATPVDNLLSPISPSNYPHGLAAAVLLSLDAVRAGDDDGVRGGVMDLVSVLSAAGVPRVLLYAAGQAGVLTGQDQAVRAPREAVDEALGRLAGCSLLTFSGDGGTVTVHRLVMRVIRERPARQGLLAGVCLAAAVALEDLAQQRVAWPDRADRRELVEQIMTMYEHCPSSRSEVGSTLTQATLRLRLWAVRSLNELGDSVAQAILIAEPLLGAMEQISGFGEHDTMAARNNLAIAYQRAGRAAEATPLFERTLADRERVLGSDHPDTLSSRDNLAAAYQQAGRAAEAIALHERALGGMVRVLGPDDPEVARVLLNLGGVQQQLGRLESARASFERALAVLEKFFGPDHLEVASALINLGIVQLQVGKLNEPRASLDRALAISEAIYGPDHPEVATALVNLGAVQMRLGDLGDARVGCERALVISEAVHGPDHPVAFVLVNLGAVQLELRARRAARVSLERARAINPSVAWRVKILQRIISIFLVLINAAAGRNHEGQQFERNPDRKSRGWENHPD